MALVFAVHTAYANGDSYRVFSLSLGDSSAREIGRSSPGVPTVSPDFRRIILDRGIAPAAGGPTVPFSWNSAQWSPDGSHLSYQILGGARSGSWIGDGDGRHSVRVASDDMGLGPQYWSPKGDRVAFALGETVLIATTDGVVTTSVAIPATPLAPSSTARVSWSRDGSRVAVLSSGRVSLLSADGSGTPGILETAGSVSGKGWSSDATRFAACVTDVGLVSIGGSASTTPYDSGVPGTVAGLNGAPASLLSQGCSGAWSPAAPRIGVADHGALKLVPSDDGPGRTVVSEGARSFVGWSPDGTKLAYQTERDTNGEAPCVVIDADTGDEIGRYPTIPVWNRSGTRFLYMRDQGVVGVHADGSGEALLLEETGNAAWMPDDVHIAAVTKDAVYVAHADGGEKRAVWTQEPVDAHWASYYDPILVLPVASPSQ